MRNRQPEQPQPSRIPDDVVERMVKLVRDLDDYQKRFFCVGADRFMDEVTEIAALLPEAVDPDLIEARKIAADTFADEQAFLDGGYDPGPTIKSIIAGIKRGRELAASEGAK